MATSRLTITIGVRWWLKHYLQGVALMSRLTGLPPNMAKVDKWISRAIYIK